MIAHSASGALITPEEEQKVWIQRQINEAVSEITGEEYRDPLEPRTNAVAYEPGEPERFARIIL